ncbi:hypothetical protein Tco_0877900 [Tanacetum coccineum]|uniref:Uncharacterized protein n=1 Tax=Tanacetum coccineum TaxID=301880 RepID=A0ABQ5C276_9ASTR
MHPKASLYSARNLGGKEIKPKPTKGSIVTSAAPEKATSASAELEGELSRRSETASAYLLDNFVSTKMKHFPFEGMLLKLESALKVRSDAGRW